VLISSKIAKHVDVLKLFASIAFNTWHPAGFGDFRQKNT